MKYAIKLDLVCEVPETLDAVEGTLPESKDVWEKEETKRQVKGVGVGKGQQSLVTTIRFDTEQERDDLLASILSIPNMTVDCEKGSQITKHPCSHDKRAGDPARCGKEEIMWEKK